MLYVTVILCANVLIIFGNAAAKGEFDIHTLVSLALSSFAGTFAIIALDGIEAFVLRKLPEMFFSPERKVYRITEGERKVYQKLGIKKWKRMIPDLGVFTGFNKDELKSTTDKAYLGRFIKEARYGVLIHTVNSVFGFFIAFIPICKAPSVWIPVYVVNFVLNALPAMALRYNLPVLERLYERAGRQK